MTATIERSDCRVALADMLVADAMTRDFLRATPGTSLLEVFAAMLRARVHHMPVVGADERCQALLELTEVVRRLPEDLVAQGGAPLVLPGSLGPVSVPAEERLTRAAAAMDHAGIDACCVVDRRGRMVGTLTARDVVAAVGRAAPRGG